LTYISKSDTVALTHAEVDSAFEGKGLGSRLAKAALDDIRRQHKTVRPQCPFVIGYIRRHPEYGDLVAGA
jgi:predicted GNAT family acetyltransferase